MNHTDPKRLEAFLDGELRPEEARSVEAHLVECAACRREAELLQRLTTTVRRARGMEPGKIGLDRFAAEVSRRAAENRPRSPAWWQRLRFAWNMEWGNLERSAALAFAVVLLVGGGLIVERQLGPRSESDLPLACRIEFIEPGEGADVTVYADSEVAVVWVSGADTG